MIKISINFLFTQAQEAHIIAENQQREAYRQKVIQEARKRLLEEHAQKLEGYMPKKVFENQEELQRFRK